MADWARREYHQDAETYRGLSAGRFLRAMVLGATNDLERRALAGGTDSAGGFTVPTVLSAELIDLMRAASVASRAGARTVPLTSDLNVVARLATDPTPAWRQENAAITEADPTFDAVTFTPQSLAVLVKVSRELLEDSINLETELPPHPDQRACAGMGPRGADRIGQRTGAARRAEPERHSHNRVGWRHYQLRAASHGTHEAAFGEPFADRHHRAHRATKERWQASPQPTTSP